MPYQLIYERSSDAKGKEPATEEQGKDVGVEVRTENDLTRIGEILDWRESNGLPLPKIRATPDSE